MKKYFNFLLFLIIFCTVFSFTQFASAQREPDNPTQVINGINYSYYEATMGETMPDFNSLVLSSTGYADNITLSLPRRGNNFAFKFEGYIEVPADGQYTFFTSSDDGSQLFIGDELVVDNDGRHGYIEKSGTIDLEAGLHAITVTYFEWRMDEGLSVSYQGPGISKIVIPDDVLYRESNLYLHAPVFPNNTVKGINYKYYEEEMTEILPDFNSMDIEKFGFTNKINLDMKERDKNFAVIYYGYFNAPTTGIYTFYTKSDDGSKLFVAGEEVVDNGGLHKEREESGMIGLQKGKHEFTIIFFQANGGSKLSAHVKGPGIDKKKINKSNLYRRTDLIHCAPPLKKVQGLTNGRLRLFCGDGTRVKWQSHFLEIDKKTRPKLYKDTNSIIVLGPNRKKIKNITGTTGEIWSSKKVGKKTNHQGWLQIMDLRNDGKSEAVATSKDGDEVRLAIVRIKKDSLKLGKKDKITFIQPNVKPKNTKISKGKLKNKILIRDKNYNILKKIKITKKFKLKEVK